MKKNLTPKQIVSELDKYIIAQDDAKKAVAIALRNRYRREKLPDALRDEVIPKNILMIGPTGVGKTEIARRLAKLANSPFLKVEATKYTEVGYVGRDVESMVRDLVEVSIQMTKNEKMKEVQEQAEELAKQTVIELLEPQSKKSTAVANPFALLFGGGSQTSYEDSAEDETLENQRISSNREKLREQLEKGELDDQMVEIEVEDVSPSIIEVFSGTGMEEMGVNFQDMLGGMFPKKKKKKKVSVKEAKKILTYEEANRLIDIDEVRRIGVQRAEQYGIIFVDELDKIASREKGHGPEVSREGVQRDILPIIEGSTVMTKYGPVKTNHMLFFAAGAFHVSTPSDLIPELQGRFPIRVELKSLTKDDFKKILTQPENALIKQYTALINTEGVEIEFNEEALVEIAEIATHVNEQTENIGARRLYTIMEKLLEDISFRADEIKEKVVIDREYVRGKLKDIITDTDLSRYIL